MNVCIHVCGPGLNVCTFIKLKLKFLLEDCGANAHDFRCAFFSERE